MKKFTKFFLLTSIILFSFILVFFTNCKTVKAFVKGSSAEYEIQKSGNATIYLQEGESAVLTFQNYNSKESNYLIWRPGNSNYVKMETNSKYNPYPNNYCLTESTSNSIKITAKVTSLTGTHHTTIAIYPLNNNKLLGYFNIMIYKPATKISFKESSKIIYVGDKKDMPEVTFTPTNVKFYLTYTSSNTAVASIDSNNNIIAKKAGYTTITVRTAFGKTSTCRIQVKSGTKATGVSLNATTKTGFKGNSFQLNATVRPTNASNKKVKWSSSDTSIAQVDSSGKVNLVGVGTATITATTENSQKTATCRITSKSPILATSVSLNKTLQTITGTGNIKLTATVKPTTTTNKTIRWTSSDTTVAKVDSSGKVTAVKPGIATITAKTSNNKTASCKITVVAKGINTLNFEIGDALLDTKNNLVATVKIKDGATTLRKDIDYTVSYSNVKTVGKNVRIKITGIGSYKGSKNFDKKIYYDFSKAILVNGYMVHKSYKIDYSENQAKLVDLECSFKFNNINLKKGEDFEISFGKNDTAGYDTGEIIMTGKGNYKGTHTYICDIPKNINNATVTIPDNNWINAVVKYGNITLKKGVDYMLMYDSTTKQVAVMGIRKCISKK